MNLHARKKMCLRLELDNHRHDSRPSLTGVIIRESGPSVSRVEEIRQQMGWCDSLPIPSIKLRCYLPDVQRLHLPPRSLQMLTAAAIIVVSPYILSKATAIGRSLSCRSSQDLFRAKLTVPSILTRCSSQILSSCA